MRGRGYGITADIVLGLIGAIIGNWIFTRLGIDTSG
ncbi:MAG: GlsB/YeaQ/YmgE family stress response membrane protein, partial [Deltaproteobacteria bacterium]|nr:GlsB/YeaQ/YmgE family stress response membrane protein [Deltaproteobacteria bacterium]